jgi:phosphoribosylaminoimidazole-succinocarboxamide synthase
MLPELLFLRRGKVRDIYEVDQDHLLIVATDRISAFDCILPNEIPRKGEVLTRLRSSGLSVQPVWSKTTS